MEGTPVYEKALRGAPRVENDVTEKHNMHHLYLLQNH